MNEITKDVPLYMNYQYQLSLWIRASTKLLNVIIIIIFRGDEMKFRVAWASQKWSKIATDKDFTSTQNC